MNAEQLRDNSYKNSTIFKEMEEASNSGKFSYETSEDLTEHFINYLRSEGFLVTKILGGFGESGWLIKW